MFALRNRLDPDLLIWDTDFSVVLQLLHAEGLRSGMRYQWVNWFDPSAEMLEEFDRLSNMELEDL